MSMKLSYEVLSIYFFNHAEILRFADLRGRSSFCPSEVARSLASAGSEEEWRGLMPRVREAAAGRP